MLILDDFLTDPKALKSIETSPFWTDPSFYWRKMDFKGWRSIDDATGIGSYIVQRMMQEPKLTNYPFYSALGFEYWPTVLSPESKVELGDDGDYYALPIHADYDVVKAVSTGEMSFPMFGAIFYVGNSDVEGGLFKYWEDENSYIEIEPKENRLIVFESHKPHGVTKIEKGIRKSIAINFWREQIMLEEGNLEYE